ncbi:MAG: carboxypeptidase M32 [Sumerlaeia bacterium]
MTSTFSIVKEKLQELHDLENIQSVLHWDMEVMMPAKGVTARGEQLTTLSALHHRLATSEELGALLQECAGDASLAPDEKCLVAEAWYDYERTKKLPEQYVRNLSDARTASYHAWTKARKNNDFHGFEPFLARNVELAREGAELLGYVESPYDALLENFERGMTTAQLQELFTPLAAELQQLVQQIIAKGQADKAWINGEWNEGRQKEFTERVLRDIGYDFEAGRIDFAAHPFCTNFDSQDVRITTRNEKTVFGLFLSSLHEAGHALYEQGFDSAVRRSLLAAAPSLGIHECNSRLWENLVGRSIPFWQHYTPILQQLFKDDRLANKSAEDFAAAASYVEPSLIRVDADEVTYSLHVVIRFELEKALIEGSLNVSELPEAWAARYKQYLGISVPNHADGCLQDVHWSEGLFGYFPTYALGNLYAAQVMETIRAQHPELDAEIARGDTRSILDFLREKIHHVGRRKLAPQIIEEATGQKLSSDAFLRAIRAKYNLN